MTTGNEFYGPVDSEPQTASRFERMRAYISEGLRILDEKMAPPPPQSQQEYISNLRNI